MLFFFFSSRRRHTRSLRDWSSDVCSSDLIAPHRLLAGSTVADFGDRGIIVVAREIADEKALVRAFRQIGRASCRKGCRYRGWADQVKEKVSRGDVTV